MKKIYFRFILIFFAIGFTTIATFFYLGYLRREQIRKNRLGIIERREIVAILNENAPFDKSKIPLLKEIEKEYNVKLFVKSKNFHYTSKKNLLKSKDTLRLIPRTPTNKIRKPNMPHPILTFERDSDKPFLRMIYLIEPRYKIVKGIRIQTPLYSAVIIKNRDNYSLLSFVFFLLAMFLFLAFLFFLVKKWYVTPLLQLENSIKSLENNLNSPELYQDNSGMLTPVYNALNDLKRKVIKEINSKEEMLRDISHDLKTPLSRIKLATEFVENEKIKARISEDVKELESLITRILDLRKVRRKNCRTNLNKFLNEVKTKYGELKMEINCDNQIIVPVCKEDLKRIFYNLVDNSIKYADIKKGLTIKAKNKEKTVEITYEDCNTKGEKPDIERVFDYFYKKNNSRNKETEKGFGLGLSIVKKITEEYGGKIKAQYSECSGLSFILEFPIDFN